MFSAQGQAGESPAILAIVMVLQHMESLTDRQAADAVRGRIDWKYLLGLSLMDAGFHYSILSLFRERWLAGKKPTRSRHVRGAGRSGGRQHHNCV